MIFNKIQRILSSALPSALLFAMLVPMAPQANAADHGSVELKIDHPATYTIETENGRITVDSESDTGSDFIVIESAPTSESGYRIVYEDRAGTETAHGYKVNSALYREDGQDDRVTLGIPDESFEEGDLVEVFSSSAGHQWISRGVALVKNRKAVVKCGHYPYFALERKGSQRQSPYKSITYFKDTVGHWAEPYIRKIVEKGIAEGKGEGWFAPEDVLTRAEMVKMAVKAFGIKVPKTMKKRPFGDVPLAAWYAPYAAAAKEYGFVRGAEGGRWFFPESPVTRAEALKILIGAAGFENLDDNFEANYLTNPGWWYVGFRDVPMESWFAKYVAFARDNNLVTGFRDGLFRPEWPISRAEMSKVLVEVMELRGEN